MQMGDESWQNYHNTVNDLVEKRDAFNMGMMGMIGGGAQDTSANATLGGGGKGTVSLDADDARMYTGQPGFDDGEEESVPQSVFPSQSKPSREEELKTKIEETYAKILGMTDSEKNNFMNTAEGQVYSENWEALKELIGPLPFEQYMRELFGEDKFNEFIRIYDDWDFPEKIDTPEDIIKEQTENEETNEFLDDQENDSELADLNLTGINDANTTESEIDKEIGQTELITTALEILISGETVDGTKDVSSIAESILDEIRNNGGFTNEESWIQKESFLSDNPVYVSKIDGNRVEMEVLTDWSAHPFGGEGTKEQNFFENAFKLFKLLLDAPETYKDIGETIVQELLGIFGEEISDYYNPGKILQENDVRISIQLEEDMGTEYKYDYFFRDGQLMYVTYNDGLVWANEDYFNKDE